MNIGDFDRKIELYSPATTTNDFGEREVAYEYQFTARAKRRDIEWSTIGEEVHGKQLVVEARTEFYLQKFRPEITEDWLVKYDGRYYELTRCDEFGRRKYSRLLGLRRDNWTPNVTVTPSP